MDEGTITRPDGRAIRPDGVAAILAAWLIQRAGEVDGIPAGTIRIDWGRGTVTIVGPSPVQRVWLGPPRLQRRDRP